MADDERPPSPDSAGGLSRRGFLTTAGLGAVGLAAVRAAAPPEAEPPPEPAADARLPVTLRVNGRTHRLRVEPRWSLLWVLRSELGLTAAKSGCERGECGACTVLLDGVPRYACMTLALEAEGVEITTLEGLAEEGGLGAVQRAFVAHDAFQCGYCTPGQIVAVEGLLRANPAPGPEEIRQGVAGNLCRCGAYPNIFRAAALAAELRQGRPDRDR